MLLTIYEDIFIFIYSFLFTFFFINLINYTYILIRLQRKIKKDFESGIEIRNKKEEKVKSMRARVE